jgi:hypothetical protein
MLFRLVFQICAVVIQLDHTQVTCGLTSANTRFESKAVCESWVQHMDMKAVFAAYYDALHDYNITHPDKAISLALDSEVKYTHTCEEVSEE